MYALKKYKLDAGIAKGIIEASIPAFSELQAWEEEKLHGIIQNLASVLEMKAASVYTTLRIALSAHAVTPGGAAEIAGILGKEESLERLRKALSWL